jgi:hypothetical protein
MEANNIIIIIWMEYEGSNEYTCKSILGYGITTRWMKVMMIKIDAGACKIWVAAAVDWVLWVVPPYLSREEGFIFFRCLGISDVWSGYRGESIWRGRGTDTSYARTYSRRPDHTSGRQTYKHILANSLFVLTPMCMGKCLEVIYCLQLLYLCQQNDQIIWFDHQPLSFWIWWNNQNGSAWAQ